MKEEKKHIMTKFAFLSLITFLIISTGTLVAQPSVGFIQIHQDDAIQSLLNKHIKVNEYNPWINGYRVQLYSVSGVNSRDKANLFRAKFLSKHPKAKVYVVYQAPYYKVRLGDFRTKLNALAYLQTISKDYPSGFVVVDKIRFKETEEEDDDKATNE